MTSWMAKAIRYPPALLSADDEGQDEGADGHAHAEEAVEEAHDPGRVVEGHVVVQRRVDGPRAKAQGDGAQAHCQKVPRKGEAQQGGGGHGGADGRHLVGAQQADDLGAHHTGDHRAAADGHADEAGAGNGQVKLRVNRGPGRAEQGVRDAKADEGDINYDQ